MSPDQTLNAVEVWAKELVEPEVVADMKAEIRGGEGVIAVPATLDSRGRRGIGAWRQALKALGRSPALAQMPVGGFRV
jgi:hypothetical protein